MTNEDVLRAAVAAAEAHLTYRLRGGQDAPEDVFLDHLARAVAYQTLRQSHPAPTVPDGWQPIASAPKDNRRVWGLYREGRGHLSDGLALAQDGGVFCGPFMCIRWMPLPTHPKDLT